MKNKKQIERINETRQSLTLPDYEVERVFDNYIYELKKVILENVSFPTSTDVKIQYCSYDKEFYIDAVDFAFVGKTKVQITRRISWQIDAEIESVIEYAKTIVNLLIKDLYTCEKALS